VRALTEENLTILIPAPAIAEAWRGGGGRQARLAQFLNRGVGDGVVNIVVLDFEMAKELGILIGRAPMSVTDALVCRCALQTGGGVVTSDPSDIGRLVPHERLWIV
jgi:hypothetical protein